jgi:acyl-coenzyme A thioesterase PaaI-like protein
MHSDEIQRLLEERSPLLRRLGIGVEDTGPTEARLRMGVLAGDLGPAGLQAGAVFTLALAAAEALGLKAFDPGTFTFTSKAAEVRFRRPARTDLQARAQIGHEEHGAALERAATEGKADVTVLVEVTDQAGERIAEGTLTLGLRQL